jgi:hypothetical protein
MKNFEFGLKTGITLNLRIASLKPNILILINVFISKYLYDCLTLLPHN